jgi:2-iminobutanoate/2-iminopropanoate deaminase
MTSTEPENVGGGAGVAGLPGTVGAAVGAVAGRVPRVTGGAALGPGTAQPAAIVAASGTAKATIGRRRQRARSIAPAWQVEPGGWRHYAAPPPRTAVIAGPGTASPRRSAIMQKPLGPYTPIVRAGDWLIVSGQVGAKDGQLADGVAGQTAQSIENVAGQLATMGASLDDVKKTLCFLVDMADFATFNEAYIAGFGDSRPARSTIAVAGLPIGAQVEIEAWAYKPE